MVLAFSFIPFFPQPLPVIIALLVAFLVYVNPQLMALGCIPIALGLLYHLSADNFIAMLGAAEVRVFVICLIVFFFVTLPVRFRRYEDAIAINVGIIAATLLFFDTTYFLSIPLVLTAAIIFKRTQAGLVVSYYALVSGPLMVFQYFQHILTISRVDFWNDPSSVPPLYVSLSSVFNHIQGAMPQFRAFDASQTLGRITWQVIGSLPAMARSVMDAIRQYTDSFPGIILFLLIISGLVWVAALILPSLVSRSHVMRAETLFPVLTAAGVTAMFFLLLTVLQHPLAFSAQIDGLRMAIGTLSTLIFAVPAALFNYAPKKKAEIEKNSKIVMVKAQGLMAKLQFVEALICKVKGSVPVDVNATETNMVIIKDKLNEILTRTTAGRYKVPELYEKIQELDMDLAVGIDSLSPELNVTLEQYQLSLNYEYTTWIRKLQELGYEVKDPAKIEFQKEQLPEARIEYIGAVLAAGRLLANEVLQLTERVYDVIRSLYDPTLPVESRTITYVKEKLEEKTAPWIACDALIIALNNWKKQYSRGISKSIESLQESLGSLANLTAQSKTLPAVLGEKFPKVMEEAKRAEDAKTELEKKKINILNITSFSDALQSSLSIAKTVLSILHEELKTKEESIESLQPIQDYFWEKNVTLGEQTASAIEKISNLKKYKPHEVMQNLSQALSYIDQCLWTIEQYNTKNELLLNYPIARKAIEDLLKKKKNISIQDLPFEPREAEEYLKLFYNERYREFTFDEDNLLLARKA